MESVQMKISYKKVFKKILFLGIAIYIVGTLLSQQKTLNAYSKEVNNYENQIEEQQEAQQSLNEIKENVNSSQYIEQIAREKLGMYLPNEKVYIDATK